MEPRATGPAPVRAVAHSAQNFAAGGLGVPQFGQARASGVAHSVQNFADAGFSVRQLAQINAAALSRTGMGRGRVPEVSRSPRRPQHRPAAQQVEVEVEHALSRVRTDVGYDPVAPQAGRGGHRAERAKERRQLVAIYV